MSDRRDMSAAVGTGGGPAAWRRAVKGAAVALSQPAWRDAAWADIFRRDTRYLSDVPADPDRVAAANRRGRELQAPAVVHGPMMKAPVWTWEVPLYFWFGGMASGASFVGLACDLAGDETSARVARKVALAALLPSPPLLMMDLGRPERFYNMLRIFKPRSPMSMGSWCLTVFGGLTAAAVGADLLGRRREARALGAAGALAGTYLGSYTGVLLASTAVPVWSGSRLFLGPIFMSTATLTGAAATRLALAATGMAVEHPTRVALGRVESGALASELVLSAINRHRLGRQGEALDTGAAARWLRAAQWLTRGGLALRLAPRGRGGRPHNAASVLFMAVALCYRFAWVNAGRASAHNDSAVAQAARRAELEGARRSAVSRSRARA